MFKRPITSLSLSGSPARSPCNTPRARTKSQSQSPPPAPKQPNAKELQQAIESHDLVMLVEVLAKMPALASLPLLDGTTPLRRAVDLGCDRSFLDVLEHHCTDSNRACQL